MSVVVGVLTTWLRLIFDLNFFPDATSFVMFEQNKPADVPIASVRCDAQFR